jgi:hypothetical protein
MVKKPPLKGLKEAQGKRGAEAHFRGRGDDLSGDMMRSASTSVYSNCDPFFRARPQVMVACGATSGINIFAIGVSNCWCPCQKV